MEPKIQSIPRGISIKGISIVISFVVAFRIAIPLLSSRGNHEDMRWCWGILVRYLTVRKVTYSHGELFVLSSRIVTIALPLMAKRIFLHFPYQIYERTVG